MDILNELRRYAPNASPYSTLYFNIRFHKET